MTQQRIKILLSLSLVCNLFALAFVSVRTVRRISANAPTSHLFRLEPIYAALRNNYAASPTRSDRPIIMLGDSLTFGGLWSEWLPVSVLNRGIPGDDVEGVRLRLDEVLRHQPSKIYLLIGINDLIQNRKPATQVITEYRALVTEIHSRFLGTLYLQSILPVRGDYYTPERAAAIIEVNLAIKAMCNDERVRFVDLHSRLVGNDGQIETRYIWDGIHLSAAGYQVWASVIND